MKQEQSSNTPDYWADRVCEVFDGITKCTLGPKQKEAIRASVRHWVIDIREDETQAIIREIERVAASSQATLTSSQIIGIIRKRLPKRP
ncbi:MAG TPA: hypothetical protein VN578_07955 [Candidatus Binatia bacterium]|jgi:hypothetical protein|nr:hypothetical protein [Candidatus Binatia bacterium]